MALKRLKLRFDDLPVGTKFIYADKEAIKICSNRAMNQFQEEMYFRANDLIWVDVDDGT